MFRDFQRDLRSFPDARTWSTLIGAPYIIVSSKGIANGKSNIINDGADFGPDTPGTHTSGINEAITYGYNRILSTYTQGDKPAINIMFKSDVYVLNDSITWTPPSSQAWINFIGPGRGTCVITASNDTFPLFNVPSTNLEDIQWKGIVFEPISSSQISIYQTGTAEQHADYHITDCFISNAGGVDISIDYINQLTITRVYGEVRFNVAHVNGRFNIFESELLDNNVVGGGNYNSNTNISIRDCEIQLTGNSGFIDIDNTANPLGIIIDNVLIHGTSPTSGTFITNSAGRVSTIAIHNFNTTVYLNSMTLTDATNIGIFNVEVPLILNGLPQFSDYPNYGLTPSIPANPPVSGTAYQNTNPYAIEIDLPIYATTSGTAGTVAYGVSSSSTVTEMTPKYVSGSTSSGAVDIVKLEVPAGWYYEYTYSGVTAGTAIIHAL